METRASKKQKQDATQEASLPKDREKRFSIEVICPENTGDVCLISITSYGISWKGLRHFFKQRLQGGSVRDNFSKDLQRLGLFDILPIRDLDGTPALEVPDVNGDVFRKLQLVFVPPKATTEMIDQTISVIKQFIILKVKDWIDPFPEDEIDSKWTMVDDSLDKYLCDEDVAGVLHKVLEANSNTIPIEHPTQLYAWDKSFAKKFYSGPTYPEAAMKDFGFPHHVVEVEEEEEE